MNSGPLMPKATAVWLVENTSLTFEQIAHFCNLHPLEVKGIADGEVAVGIKGMDPVVRGQISREELDKAQKNPDHSLVLSPPKVKLPDVKRSKKGPRYTPVSRRHDRPNAILWLLRNHAELKDAQLMRLVGTTKNTIEQVRDRSHWNSANLAPMDPVTLGLCSQIDLDFEVQRASKDRPQPVVMDGGQTLLPASETTKQHEPSEQEQAASEPRRRREEERMEVESVFAKLKQMKKVDSE